MSNELIQQIDVKTLKPSPTNPRKGFTASEDNEIAESVQEKGILYPLTIRDIGAYYEIVDGERRYRAATVLQLKTVPCIVVTLSDQEVLDAQIISHVQRKNINPIEEAQAFGKLLGRSNIASVAKTVGKSESYVARRKSLTTLIPALAEATEKGALPVTHALEIARCSKETQEEIYSGKNGDAWYSLKRELSRGDIPSIKSLKERIAGFSRELSTARFDKTDASLIPAAGACATCPFNTTTNPGLFGDLGKAALCKNPRCFDGKTEVHIKRTIEAQPELVQVSANWGRTQAGALSRDKYDVDPKSKLKAIVVQGDGDEVGKIIPIKLRGNAGETGSSKSSSTPGKLSKAEKAAREKRKKEIYEYRVSQEARIRARALAIKNSDQKTVIAILPVVAAMMAQAPIFTHYGKGAELRKAVAKLTGGTFPGQHNEDPKVFASKAVALNKLIVGMAMSFGQIDDPLAHVEDDSYIEFVCKVMNIPYAKLHADVKREWEEAKKPKKAAA